MHLLASVRTFVCQFVRAFLFEPFDLRGLVLLSAAQSTEDSLSVQGLCLCVK